MASDQTGDTPPRYNPLTVYRATVRIRRTRPDGTPWPVKPGAERIDGLTAFFVPDAPMGGDDPRYPGEWRFSVLGREWEALDPPDARDDDDLAPVSVAEGDLADVRAVMDRREWKRRGGTWW